MAQVRMLYRGCKVWVDADEAGEPKVERNLVQVRYRREDKASYSAKLTQVSALPSEAMAAPAAPAVDVAGVVDAAPMSAGATPAGAAPPKRPRARRAAAPRKRAPAAGVGDVVIIYADGSCFGNPGPAGVGVLLEWKGRSKEISQFLGEGTNNIAELTAIEVALQNVKKRDVPIRIHTDSQYSIGVLSQGWKVKANQALVERIQVLMAEFPDLELVKVRGHSGDPRNERVDQLARDAILKSGNRG
ncbi:MAG: ribonuclease HI [Planctomycetes bacterium]|nr:ribonuclease HI [Planctomycetota bacterium]